MQRQILSEVSDRTFARWKRAVAIFAELGEDAEAAIHEATRPNGTVNHSKLERLADARSDAVRDDTA
jgi:hypothetical protein